MAARISEGKFESRSLAREYVLAGRGMVTVRSVRTGDRYTYKLAPRGGVLEVFRVHRAFSPPRREFLGHVGLDGAFQVGALGALHADKAVRAAEYLFRVLRPGAPDEVPAVLEIWHEGVCGCCGRALTVPESIKTGFGPKCLARGDL